MHPNEELKKLKILIDDGAISREEFNELRKRLLQNNSEENCLRGDNKSSKLKGIAKESIIPTEKKPHSEKGNIKDAEKELQGGNEFTYYSYGLLLLVSGILGFVFWFRYDNLIFALVIALIAATISTMVLKFIQKLKVKNLLLIFLSALFCIIIFIPIDNTEKQTDEASKGRSRPGEIATGKQSIGEYLISNTFVDHENGNAIYITFTSNSRGAWGAMKMTMGSCDFVYSYILEGRDIQLTYTGSTCTGFQGSSATMKFNDDKTISLLYLEERFVFSPL